MIISIDGKKGFNTIQHPFMINIWKKLRIEGKDLSIIRSIWGKYKTISSKIRN
jgi:hypothetical protein